MATKKKTAKAGKAAKKAGNNPYLRRILNDEELRHTLWSAFDAGRDAYGRLSNGKTATKTLIEDKKLHKDLKEAASALREATETLKEGGRKRKKRKGGLVRKVALLVVAAGLALVLSERLRELVLDALFGSEEEFEYASSTNGASANLGSNSETATV